MGDQFTAESTLFEKSQISEDLKSVANPCQSIFFSSCCCHEANKAQESRLHNPRRRSSSSGIKQQRKDSDKSKSLKFLGSSQAEKHFLKTKKSSDSTKGHENVKETMLNKSQHKKKLLKDDYGASKDYEDINSHTNDMQSFTAQLSNIAVDGSVADIPLGISNKDSGIKSSLNSIGSQLEDSYYAKNDASQYDSQATASKHEAREQPQSFRSPPSPQMDEQTQSAPLYYRVMPGPTQGSSKPQYHLGEQLNMAYHQGQENHKFKVSSNWQHDSPMAKEYTQKANQFDEILNPLKDDRREQGNGVYPPQLLQQQSGQVPLYFQPYPYASSMMQLRPGESYIPVSQSFVDKGKNWNDNSYPVNWFPESTLGAPDVLAARGLDTDKLFTDLLEARYQQPLENDTAALEEDLPPGQTIQSTENSQELQNFEDAMASGDINGIIPVKMKVIRRASRRQSSVVPTVEPSAPSESSRPSDSTAPFEPAVPSAISIPSYTAKYQFCVVNTVKSRKACSPLVCSRMDNIVNGTIIRE